MRGFSASLATPVLAVLAAGLSLQVSPAAPGGPAPAQLATYPQATISNRLVKVHFYLPDAQKGYYRGTRFDWSGMISRVECHGHSFFCEFRETHDPLNHDDVCGAAEEFGMTVLPPGFKEAKPGETFLKIGIGALRRGDDSEYGFWKKYEIVQPGEWRVSQTADGVEFTQTLQAPGGWAYTYTKTLRLDPDAPVLTISRTLRNSGTRTIETDHYGHNFLRLDDVPAESDYALEFPFKPRFGAGAQTQGCLEVRGNSLVYTKSVPPDQAVWAPLEGFSKPEDNRVRVVNKRTRAALTITTSLPLARLVLYSSRGVICPEPFVSFTLGPGEEKRWSTSYLFDAPG